MKILMIYIAVVVWFHGGGLASGLAGMYEPHFIIDYQVLAENIKVKYVKLTLLTIVDIVDNDYVHYRWLL